VATFDIDTLDPQQFSDDPSFQVVMAMFEPAFEWDDLSKTPKLTPLTAAGPAEITENGKVWTIRLKHGILFTDDPAFKGKPRELTADDYVYSYKRWLDPNLRRGGQPVLTDLIIGARPVVEAAKKTGKFDYDAAFEGLRALDRYTIRIRLSETNYPNVRDLLGFVGAAAREVVDAAGGDIRARPVGTGPFRLEGVEARVAIDARGQSEISRRVLPAEQRSGRRGDRREHEGQASSCRPASSRSTSSTRTLRGSSCSSRADSTSCSCAARSRRACSSATRSSRNTRRAASWWRVFAEPFTFSLYFNTKDPVVGGMTKERIALRRAIALGGTPTRSSRSCSRGRRFRRTS
jgi:hypothetical protein